MKFRTSCPPVSLFTAQVLNYCPENFLPIKVQYVRSILCITCDIETKDVCVACISMHKPDSMNYLMKYFCVLTFNDEGIVDFWGYCSTISTGVLHLENTGTRSKEMSTSDFMDGR